IVRRRTDERSRELGQSLFCARQMAGNNLHNCAECYPTKKRGHIVGPHSDATVAGWAPDHFLLGRAVNVNASAESMRVGHFQTAQPDDAGDNGITPRRIRLKNFAGPVAIVKHGSRGRVVANFFARFAETQVALSSVPNHRPDRIWKWKRDK